VERRTTPPRGAERTLNGWDGRRASGDWCAPNRDGVADKDARQQHHPRFSRTNIGVRRLQHPTEPITLSSLARQVISKKRRPPSPSGGTASIRSREGSCGERPADDLVHFIPAAVEALGLGQARVTPSAPAAPNARYTCCWDGSSTLAPTPTNPAPSMTCAPESGSNTSNWKCSNSWPKPSRPMHLLAEQRDDFPGNHSSSETLSGAGAGSG
jgi:hypothetical protein